MICCMPGLKHESPMPCMNTVGREDALEDALEDAARARVSAVVFIENMTRTTTEKDEI